MKKALGKLVEPCTASTVLVLKRLEPRPTVSMTPENVDRGQNDGSSPSLNERIKSLAIGPGSPSPVGKAHSGRTRHSGSPDTTQGSPSSTRQSKYVNAEDAFKVRCLHDLGLTLPAEKRIAAAYEISKDIKLYSADALLEIWTVAEDLTTERAPQEARKAGFALLKASVSHSGILKERERFYDMIVTPVDPSQASLQISALQELTKKGEELHPFEAKLVLFLNHSLEGWFLAAERAREARAGTGSAKFEPNRNLSGLASGTGRSDDDSGKDLSSKDSLKQSTLGEETTLVGAYYLVADILSNHPEVFYDDQLKFLIERVTSIALAARSRKDIRGTLKIFLAITGKGRLPASALEPCIHVFCNIYGIPDTKFEEEVWGCLSSLLKSNHQAAMKSILLELLIDPPKDSSTEKTITVVRGALLTIGRVARDNSLGGVLVNDIQSLARGLKNVHALYAQLEFDTLKTISSLIFNKHFAYALGEEDWSILVEKVEENFGAPPTLTTRITSSSPLYKLMLSDHLSEREITSEISEEIQNVAERIMYLLQTDWGSLDLRKLMVVTNVLVHMALRVPSVWKDATNAMRIQGLLDPGNDNWMPHLRMVFSNVLKDVSQTEDASCSVVQIFEKIFPTLRTDTRKKSMYENCLRDACQILSSNTNVPISVVACLAEVAAQCGPDIENDTFEPLLDMIEKALKISLSDPAVCAEALGRIVDCLIKMFLRSLPQSSLKTRRLYNLVLSLAAPSNPTTVRLSVIKLLTRLRCDAKEAIEVVSFPDSLGLASILCRTEATALSQDSVPTSSNRTSTYEQPALRTGRSSVIDSFKTVRSRSTTRSANFRERTLQPTHPLWMYDGPFRGLPEDPQHGPSQVVYSKLSSTEIPNVLDLSTWLDVVISILDEGSDWEVYSYILVHLPSQLSNRSLFARHVRQLQTMLNLVVAQVERTGNRPFTTPLPETGIKPRDIVLCLYHTLTMLLPYNEHFGRRELESTVRAFANGLDRWDGAGKCCIHALALCCHEIPSIIDKWMFNVIQKLQQKITQSDLAIDILEFLSGLSGLPDACSTATAKVPDAHSGASAEDGGFYMTVFGICIRYLDYARDQRQAQTGNAGIRSSLQPSRQSGSASEDAPGAEASQASDAQTSLSEYVSTLAYHVITSWFLTIEVSRRARHVGWITKGLACKDNSGKPMMEEQSQVILDMMHRTVFSDLGETQPDERFVDPDETPIRKTWLDGMSILTLEILPSSNSGQFTKRQASGTTHASYYHNTAKMPEHHVKGRTSDSSSHSQGLPNVYPNHMFLQLSSTIAPLPIPLQPIVLPDNDVIQRALRNFDRTDTVDGHKAGVIYIGEGQSSEADILANSRGTDAYEAFLLGLGTKVKLQDAKFNTQGLDRVSNIDGTDTYAWRDRVTEIVFHVPTMMPTDPENDPQGVKKKAHVGNDRVKIVYNNSGRMFDFNTFPSEMNFVNIVITPEAHTGGGRLVTARKLRKKATEVDKAESLATELYGYYKVQTICSSKFPQLSPAASLKVVSAEALPNFVRNLALNASLFCQIWSVVLGHGEYYSSWRVRLKKIIRLRKEYANTNVSANVAYPLGPGPPSIYDGDSYTGVVSVGGLAEPDYFHMSLDFTRWT